MVALQQYVEMRSSLNELMNKSQYPFFQWYTKLLIPEEGV